jgi:hypothetical protein
VPFVTRSNDPDGSMTNGPLEVVIYGATELVTRPIMLGPGQVNHSARSTPAVIASAAMAAGPAAVPPAATPARASGHRGEATQQLHGHKVPSPSVIRKDDAPVVSERRPEGETHEPTEQPGLPRRIRTRHSGLRRLTQDPDVTLNPLTLNV